MTPEEQLEQDKYDYAQYVRRTITGENGVLKHEMLSFDNWQWNNRGWKIKEENE